MYVVASDNRRISLVSIVVSTVSPVTQKAEDEFKNRQ